MSPACPWRKKVKFSLHYCLCSLYSLIVFLAHGQPGMEVGGGVELAEFLRAQMETYRVICISQEQEGQYQKKIDSSTIHLNKSHDLL